MAELDNFKPVETFVINPKSITLGQLYGQFDVNTHEWTDGILPSLLRRGAIAKKELNYWYIFDGPVDALWIESMNTLLDDNKKLCLTSGEIIKLLPTQTMIFETDNLKYASPATVSRCGMIYFSDQLVTNKALIDCWIKSLSAKWQILIPELTNIVNQLLYPALELLRTGIREIVPTSDTTIIKSFINLINTKLTPNIEPDKIKTLLTPWATFAVVWSIGATCEYDGRCLFSQWIREMQIKFQHNIPFPTEGLVYDYRLDDIEQTDSSIEATISNPSLASKTMIWKKWTEYASPVLINGNTQFFDIKIPTLDTLRYSYLIEYLLENKTNVVCVGPTGSGKSLTISTKLAENMQKCYVCDFINFSVKTTANTIQDLIDSKLEKRKKNVYGPAVTKRQIFFIDDFNMPIIETYGAQPPLELIRQLVENKGWYDKKQIGSFRKVEDVNIISAMGPTSSGANPVSSRVLRHFHFLTFPEMDDDVKKNIFRTILKSWLIRTPSCLNLLDSVVTASLEIFSSVCRDLLPTPDKPHYIFNLRNIARIFQGMLMAEPEKINNENELISLWGHEILRVIGDRLINAKDTQLFTELLHNIIQKYFKIANTKDLLNEETLLYADFCNNVARYERIYDQRKIKQALLEVLEEYNDTSSSPLNLVLFEEAISHVCRISRVLRQPCGNALLLGMGGAGRKSLTQLSTFLGEHEYSQIESRRGYGINDWKEDIKKIMLRAGLKSQSVVLFFPSHQIKEDFYLEDINAILNTGDVPNLYKFDELDVIFKEMRPVIQGKLQITKTNLFNAFLRNVRSNLHIVITMSPIGETFRSRIRTYPAVINCCTIDWFHPWTKKALEEVAMQFIEEIKDDNITDDTLHAIVNTCQFMHSSTIDASQDFLRTVNRRNYVTPASYLEMLRSYTKLLADKKSELASGILRLSTGLAKLAETEDEVKKMQVLLIEMKPKLENAAQETSSIIEKIRIDTLEAMKTRVQAENSEREATKLKEQSEAIKKSAEADLSEVKPMLHAAEESLKSLNKNDITEVKAMKRPPPGVILVIEAICVIKDIKPLKIPGKRPGEKILDYWTPGSQLLSDAGRFMNDLTNFEKSKITPEIISNLSYYINNPAFQPTKIASVSKACHSLCLWILAMYNYYFVNLKVTPKLAALSEAETVLTETERQLQIAMLKLREVEQGIDKLHEVLNMEKAKQQKLEEEKQLCEDRMSRAIRLINGLVNEQKRWLVCCNDIQRANANCVGDILISSGAIAYLGPFSDTFRGRLLDSWRRTLQDVIPHTPECTPISILGDPVQIRQWQINGLPVDTFSIENAVLAMNSNRWPLFIDPQRQAIKWLKRSAKKGGLSITKITDNNLCRIIENCVRFGQVCIIQDIGLELDSILDNVLSINLFNYGGLLSLKIGDNIVPYNNNFKLYMTTTIANPHYAPQISAKVSIINFTLTSNALLDQMLSLTVIQERPDLEEMKSMSIIKHDQMEKDLKEIEDRILQRVNSAQGSTVDDIDLIVTLESSKVKSEEIKSNILATENARIEIDESRLLYVPVAERARILFLCIYDLQKIDFMYQYSLEWFINIFIKSINQSEKHDDLNERISVINYTFTISLYNNVCSSLFERNKLHFAFLLCINIELVEQLISNNEWKLFLVGGTPFKIKSNPAPQWLPAQSWDGIQALDSLNSFAGFSDYFTSNLEYFETIFGHDEPEQFNLLPNWANNLDDFQKLLLLKYLRPDRLINAVQLYVSKHLSSHLIEPQTAELSIIYQESSPLIPIIFILSSGTDPASELYKFAETKTMTKRLHSISLGQGQGPRAGAMLRQAVESGDWVFFQNCHLAPSWMPVLEQLVTSFPETIHKDFRLWLTSMPTNDFPSSVLENSMKITVEPPRGVKANLLRAYINQISAHKHLVEATESTTSSIKSLLFSLGLFHSILLERRKFGPLGFNIPYEFSDGDLVICISQLSMFIREYHQLPFEVLIYTAGEINYGGRITDQWDRRCIITLLHDYYREDAITPGHIFDAQGFYYQLGETATFEDYVNYIKTLPINEHAELFGLHANADITYATEEATACMKSLLILQSNNKAEINVNFESNVIQIVEDITKKIPESFDIKEVQEKYPITYSESLNTVLQHEVKRYNKLLEVLKVSLDELLKASNGLIVMTDNLETMARNIVNNEVPQLWHDNGYPSLKPLSAWLIELHNRVKFMRHWHDKGIPTAFWISGFIFPQTLLTATLQNFARRYKVAIDTIGFTFEVTKTIPSVKPINACIVYGFFLEGCRWSGTTLEESKLRELYTEMSPIALTPEQNCNKREPGHEIYVCPVYKTLKRSGTLSTTGHSTNFILSVDLPTKIPAQHWIKRGAALICTLDY